MIAPKASQLTYRYFDDLRSISTNRQDWKRPRWKLTEAIPVVPLNISKSLPNWFVIFSFLEKQQKHASNRLAYDLAKFSNLINRSPQCAYLCAGFRCANACLPRDLLLPKDPHKDLFLLFWSSAPAKTYVTIGSSKQCIVVVVRHVCCLASADPLQGRGAGRTRCGQGHQQEFSAPPAASMLASYRLVRVRV